MHLGELRHINKLRYWPLESVLHDKYLFPKADADALASFLSPMLRLHPDKRAKASELTHHNWLEGVVVQGEIDVIRRLEIDEAHKRKASQDARRKEEEEGRDRSSSASRERADNLDMNMTERDAMKPVDDSVLPMEDGEVVDEQERQQQQHKPPILSAPPPAHHPQQPPSGIAKALSSNAPNGKGRQSSSAGKQGSKRRS